MGLWCRLSTLRIKKGHKQRCTSDVYSFEKMLETAVRNKSFVSLFSTIISRGTAFSLKLRPSAGEIFTQLANAAQKEAFLMFISAIGRLSARKRELVATKEKKKERNQNLPVSPRFLSFP